MTLRSLVISAVILAAPAQPAIAAREENCDNDVCIIVMERPDRAEVVGRNDRPYDVTLVFELTSVQNVQMLPDSRVELLLPAGRSRAIATLRKRAAGQPWSYRYVWRFNDGDARAEHDATYRYAVGGCASPLIRATGRVPDESECEQVRAAREGRVVEVRTSSRVPDVTTVVVRHGDGTYGEYGVSRESDS